MTDCIFCKIIAKEAPANIVHEDNDFIVFHDIKPAAPLHVLLVPKKHIESLKDVAPEDKDLMGELILLAQKVARDHNKEGYKLIYNVGREGGQIVDHVHVHLLAQ